MQTQPTVNPIYTGPWDCFKKTMQWEGIGGLYKGVASPLVGQMFFRAVLFSCTRCHDHRSGGDDDDGDERVLTCETRSVWSVASGIAT